VSLAKVPGLGLVIATPLVADSALIYLFSLLHLPPFFAIGVVEMSPLALSTFLAFSAALVSAQQSTFPATPLASKRYSYPTGIVSPRLVCPV
jgi:hypothetical protein